MEILIGLLAGLLLGAIALVVIRSKSADEVEPLASSPSGLNEAELLVLKSVIRDEVTQATQSAMQANSDGTEKFFVAQAATLEEKTKSLLTPAETILKALDERVEKLTTSYNTHQGKVSRLTEEMMGMNTAANKMVQAMHSPVSRGKWGENSLRNIIETAGMLPYSDFTEQTTGEIEGRILRPDVVINLPNQGSLAVDAKAPEFAEAYEKMIATESIEEQQLLLADHIKSMRAHVKTLSLKEYWNQFDRSPEFVVMFVPLESMLSDALKADPSLVDDAMRSRVLIASPMNLLALLLAAHRGWQDFRVQEDAKKIGDLTKELYKRFSTLFDYVRKTGKGIQQSTTNYNNLIGALESRVLPTLRKLDDLNVVDGEIASIEPLETSIRELSVPEETPEIENFDS
ncbi:MAG: DNA recombination protein RmuC [Actinomycetota bacterium]|nr:DNA recombination protein RmuC [Actinomycetota bacterium]MEC7607984.1 DNA recombination protein RmuC [Actinomycetota bacterium]MEC8391984.1 DNA recombination protein RmuC [Actinomycetota bacterium]